MTEPTTQPIKIDGYHAHVYYTAETRPRAAQPRETIATALDVEVRELSDAPKGPTRSRSSGSRSPLRSSRRSCRG
jgi:aromatic ring-cleaving dioxygenase